METLLQGALLVAVVVCLCGTVVRVSKDEFGDAFEGGRLSRFCGKHATACDPENLEASLHALHNLEGVQEDLVLWRTQWAGGTFVALTLLAVACACRIPVGKVTVLVVTAFFASTCAFHFQHSWYSGHVSKHPREARARCIQKLLGAPSPEFSYYGV